VEGCYKFLHKVWRTVTEHAPAFNPDLPLPAYADMNGVDREIFQWSNKTIAGVTHDIEQAFQFNTVISKIREFVNALNKQTPQPSGNAVMTHALITLLKLLSPIAPHLCEELWHKLGQRNSSIHTESWPTAVAEALVADSVEIVVQVNGKLRDRFDVPNNTAKEQLEDTALNLEKIKSYTDGQTIVKVIVVPNKLVNIVLKPN
jgi:leucyl-tRNA synthetase